MNIRTATLQDIDQIAAVEKECFPAAEAATKEEFEADDIWCKYAPGIPEPRLCRRTFKKSDRRCKRPGKKRSCPYVQRPAGALLCKIWF